MAERVDNRRRRRYNALVGLRDTAIKTDKDADNRGGVFCAASSSFPAKPSGGKERLFAAGRMGIMANDVTSSDAPVSEQQPIQGNTGWAQLTARYLRDLPRQLDGITAVLEVRDYRGVKAHAHRIKGTSGTYRLEAISKQAGRIERLADNRDIQAITTAVSEARRLVELEISQFGSQGVRSEDANGRGSNG